jgi:LytS/YehU family sensor histidine kinase
LSRYFAYGETIERIDIIYTLLFHLSLLIGVGFNSFVLIPRFLARKKWLIYFPALGGLIYTSIWLNQFTFETLSDWLFPGYFFISYYEWIDLFTFIVAYLGITSLVQFSRSWFREADAQRKLAEISKAAGEQEMRSLKAQIQPHFLFNSLNTIYGLIRKSPQQAADAVLRLSDLLRYTIRQSGEDLVSLSDEIAYINDYVEFQKMRSDFAEAIRFEVVGDTDRVQIAPLLFITFVENAFKYGSDEVDIRISVDSNRVRFDCDNKIALSGDGDTLKSNLLVGNTSSRNRRGGDMDSSVDMREKFVSAKNGTGIENARKRLGLTYPDRHTLSVRQDGDLFKVSLELRR